MASVPGPPAGLCVCAPTWPLPLSMWLSLEGVGVALSSWGAWSGIHPPPPAVQLSRRARFGAELPLAGSLRAKRHRGRCLRAGLPSPSHPPVPGSPVPLQPPAWSMTRGRDDHLLHVPDMRWRRRAFMILASSAPNVLVAWRQHGVVEFTHVGPRV